MATCSSSFQIMGSFTTPATYDDHSFLFPASSTKSRLFSEPWRRKVLLIQASDASCRMLQHHPVAQKTPSLGSSITFCSLAWGIQPSLLSHFFLISFPSWLSKTALACMGSGLPLTWGDREEDFQASFLGELQSSATACINSLPSLRENKWSSLH